jgi:hypothetical protein
MPLHDWSNTDGWEGMHQLWVSSLVRHLRKRLPAGYRAVLGTGPAMSVGAPPVKPDVWVRPCGEQGPVGATGRDVAGPLEPDGEMLAVATLDTVPTLFIERDRRLVAAVEIVSPRNKDRPSSRESTTQRYASYLVGGTHLMVLDMLPHPFGFSLAEGIEADIGLPPQSPLPAPFAASYRVGDPAPPTGRLVAFWRRGLKVGSPLPELALPLTVQESVRVDLETTYMSAAEDAYL